ncbi:protein vav [Neodiprion virginianus]|uniref:protein vav n=1 Tax=Neodiprion virginianus TaxID=2961670 RepID=UPI001EE75819|nr:protein vav [Neodiprion virginianus]
MNTGDSDADPSNGWHECASWLTRCGALRSDHKANWPSATAFDLAYTLRDGVLLCNLLNMVDPGCVDMKDVNQKPQLAQFLCLRNIKIFLSACSSVFGLSESELFEPSMLFDLSNFHRVLCTLSALSICPRLRRKGIEGFSIGRDRSQEDIYKDLQSAGVGREDEGRRRRFRRREGNEAGVGGDSRDPVEEEDGYGVFCSHAQSEEIYQDLCSLHMPPPTSTTQGVPASGGEKRDYVVQELVETERNYSEVLVNLLRHFARPLSPLLRPEDSACIFFGIEELSIIHTDFHSKLRIARNGADLARIFLDWREKFLLYGDYCANLTLAQITVRDVCRNELINEVVIRCQEEANNGRFKLLDILSVPMQRILKYHLLLQKLVEETPREWIEDRRQLEKAREAMVDVAQYINEVKRDSDTLDLIRDIQASIVGWDVTEDTQLKNYGRLLKDGELKVKAHNDQRVKARWAFVFEQVVLICKAERGDQYCYKETLRLDDYRLEDHMERRTMGRDSRWSYQWLLVHKQAYTAYTLYARTDDQKKAWIKALREAMDNINPAACKSTDHKFKLTTFDTAQYCQHCGKFLKGRIFQGYRCTSCRFSVHKQCIMYSGRCTPMPPPLPYELALSPKLWFVGEMGRDTATSRLEHREDGTYMLRVRRAGQPRVGNETSYALSIKAYGRVKHIRVFKREADGAVHYYLSESRFFKSVVELIEYYERASLAENFEDLDQRLLWPFRRVLAKALFDFRGGEPNQLSLRRGCRVVVLSKEGDARGWWKGKIGDQVGFFPKEYVAEE